MHSTLDNKFVEGEFASLEEQLSNLAREGGFKPSPPPTSHKTFRFPPASIRELADWKLADWRYLALIGSLLAASTGVAAWWWASSGHKETMAPPAPQAQTAQKEAAPANVAPTAVAPASDLAQQLQPLERDLAALRQAVEQLEVAQRQLVRDNENIASQLKASQAEMARNNNAIGQIKATQIQMARESETVTERLNASQEKLARLIADGPGSKVTPEDPKVTPEEAKATPEEPRVSDETPKVMPGIPVPRPRRAANVAEPLRPAPAPSRPQAKKPPSSPTWPWSR